jgi:hypothetical protein
MDIETFITYLFYTQNNTKVYHWTTKIYARHKASCSFLHEIDDLIDQFVEVYSGRYQRPDFVNSKKSIKVYQWSDEEAYSKLDEFKRILEKQVPKFLQSSDTELMNIRDEMLALVNKTLYLYSLS